MKRNLPIIRAEQLFVLMAQGLQHFFAFVLSNLATAFFSQVTHLCLFRSFLCFHLFFGNYIAITLAHVLIFANVFLFFLKFFYCLYVFFLKVIRYCAIFFKERENEVSKEKTWRDSKWMST